MIGNIDKEKGEWYIKVNERRQNEVLSIKRKQERLLNGVSISKAGYY